jgi:TP901 family phage tail tape measure protein
MATLTAQLIVSLVDRVTAPARAMEGQLGRLRGMAARNQQQMDAMRGRMLDAVGAGWALYHALKAPTEAGLKFNGWLEDLRQKADISVDRLGELGKQIREIGVATAQGAEQAKNAIDFLLGMGASEQVSMALATPIGKAATAYKALPEDLAQALYAAVDNLKTPAAEGAAALDAMASAGKDGGFELKDMAAQFPVITAAAQNLGIRGVKGVADLSAALEIARKGAADGTIAATNFKAFLQNLTMPETLKAFGEKGVNVIEEINKATAAGESPVEHMLAVIDRVTKGGRIDLLGQLFGRKEALQFITPMLANMDEYRRIRETALRSAGMVEADFQSRLQTGEGALMRNRARLENINILIGSALLPAIAGIVDKAAPLLQMIADLVERFPKATGVVIELAAGLVGLRIATLAARWAFLFLKGGVLEAAIGIARGAGLIALAGAKIVNFARMVQAVGLSMTLLSVTGGTGILAGVVSGLSGAAGAIAGIAAGIGAAIAGISAPIWLAIGAVAGLALAIHHYWEPISDFVSGFASVIGGALGALVSKIAGFGREIAAAVAGWALQKLIDFASLLGIDEGTVRGAVDAALSAVSGFVSSVVGFFAAIPGQIGNWFGEIFSVAHYSDEARAGFHSAGEAAAQALLDALNGAVSGILAMFQNLGARIVEIIKLIDLNGAGLALMQSLLDGLKAGAQAVLDYVANIGGTIRGAVSNAASGAWNKVKGAVGLGGGEPQPVEARAGGGPVLPGRPYWVGENGPELVSFDRMGFVHSARDTATMLAGLRRMIAPVAAFGAPFAAGLAPASLSPAAAMPAAVAAPQVVNRAVQVTIAPGAIVLHGVDNPEKIAEALLPVLRRKLSDALSGGQFDQVYAVGG